MRRPAARATGRAYAGCARRTRRGGEGSVTSDICCPPEAIPRAGRRDQPEGAEQIEAVRKTQVAKGGCWDLDGDPAPTLSEFQALFESAIETECGDKPETVAFYKEKYRRLLECPTLANARLDEIDEGVVDAYEQTRRRQLSRYKRPVPPGSVNRELATLSRALRLARKWKLIAAVPAIGRLPGERTREFVLSHDLEDSYLEACAQPLRDAAVLMLDTGARVGEVCALKWAHVFLKPAIGARHGHIRIRDGKTKNAKRTLSLTPRVAEMLRRRAVRNACFRATRRMRRSWSRHSTTSTKAPGNYSGTGRSS